MARRVITPGGKQARIDGIPEIKERITEILKTVSSKDARQMANSAKGVYMQGAQILKKKAQELAPYDDGRKEGTHLKEAIVAAYGKATKDNVIVTVNYKRAPHAFIAEFGTKQRHTKKGANRGVMPAHPYMRPALAQTRNQIVTVIADGLKKLIEDTAKK